MATIVVVDDEPATLKLVTALLSARGHRVVALSDGTGLTAAVTGEKPDLVLLDLQLPGKDGVALLAEVRALAAPAPKVAAMSAASAEEKQRALAAGFDAFLQKPIQVAGFAREVGALLG